MPDRPTVTAPESWVTIDPGLSKGCVLVEWRHDRPVAFHQFDGRNVGLTYAMLKRLRPKVVVTEGGGYVGDNAKTALQLERVRETIRTTAKLMGVRYVHEPTSNEWRPVLDIRVRPKRIAKVQARAACDMLARDLVRPVALAAEATNDDLREALLIGVACSRHWGWA